MSLEKYDVNSKFPCIIPTIAEDYTRTRYYYKTFFEYLPIDEITLIGPESLRTILEKDIDEGLFEDHRVCFIDESELVPIGEVKKAYRILEQNATQPNPSSVNWYYQQFLKMAISLVCNADYYLCWDSDTIPLRKINMFSENNKPYLDTKTECNTSYFTTIERLFHYNKIIEKSFISEHMLFNTSFMKELISEIEKTDFEGDKFYIKIINSLGYDNLAVGFSEFETYGTFIGMRHPSAYMLRNWKSFRNLSFFVSLEDFNEEDREWLARDYDAVTFEKYQETEPRLTDLFRNQRYREKLTSEQFFLSVLESGALGEYSNGTIVHDGLVAPI